VSQAFIRWKTYAFIRPESTDAKANELDFVYVNTHIINKNYIAACRFSTKKELWGTKLH
jgi:hypothetical protein